MDLVGHSITKFFGVLNVVEDIQDVLSAVNEPDLEPSQTVLKTRNEKTVQEKLDEAQMIEVIAEVGKLFEFNARDHLGIQGNTKMSLMVSLFGLGSSGCGWGESHTLRIS